MANKSKRKELDWLKHQEAVDTARRLLAHHTDVVQSNLKPILAAILPSVTALRSSTSRNCLLFFRVRPLPQPLLQHQRSNQPDATSSVCCLSCLCSSVCA